MIETKKLICPHCHKNNFVVRLEATYVYSYVIDSDAPGIHNTDEFLSYMYDDREQKESNQYIECSSCGAKFPCYFNVWNKNIGVEDLQGIINSKE